MSRILTVLILIIALCLSCANPGSGPDGGPYDETPPRILAMTPAIGATQAKAKKVTISFDEYIKIENASEKIIVSPPQIEMPEIKTQGKRISVTLLDTLQPNTTYTIDFSDAITDATEGNPLGNFTYYFATGEQLDTMEVSGHVLAAEDLEPVKGILVGLHRDTTDTALLRRAFDRVARTDAAGHFCIKGVAPGNYRIYALNDMDGDFRLSPGERMAFTSRTITPSSFPDLRFDTLWTDTVHYDTIRAVPFTHYLPDDVVLLAFTETRTDRYLLKTQRDVPEWWRAYFTAPSPSGHVPEVRGLNFDATDAFLEQRSERGDTITYWLRSLDRFPEPDTLRMTYTYECFDDSIAQHVLRTDTLELIPRHTLAKRLKDQEDALAKWEKKREKRHRRGDYSDETPPVEPLKITGPAPSRLTPDQNLTLGFEEPLVRLDTAAFHLFLQQDSLLHPIPGRLRPRPGDLLNFTLQGEWRPGCRYQLLVDSAAATGLSGKTSLPLKFDFSVPRTEELGSLFLLLPDIDSAAVVQLLQKDGKALRQLDVKNGRADFFYLKPGTYYLRLFRDPNGNGQWDTGCYADGLQPEQVYYFPAPIEVRANWDIEQTWRTDEMPLTKQKPAELMKQKADKKKTARSRNAERERMKR